MNILLIHSDNTSLTEHSFLDQHQEYFSVPQNKEVDQHISEFIQTDIKPNEPDALFIKYALTDNYIAFIGLRLAYHIRLGEDEELAKKPIVFVGEETPYELMKLSDYSDILATQGTYFIREDNEEATSIIKKLKADERKGLGDRNDFLNKINIKPPSNYDSRHSLANELSLYTWCKYIECADQLDNVLQHVKYDLYFKYKILIHEISNNEKSLNTIPKFDYRAKVLLIDDEANKGWGIYYHHLFSNSNEISFKSYNVDRRKKQDKIINDLVSKLDDEKPDVILLDLRLNEIDTNEKDPKKLTGYKVLDEIKRINEGIQVIVTTASNKAPVFKELMEFGANGYIIKDNNPVESIAHLTSQIDRSLKEAKALKGFYENLNVPYNKIYDNKLDRLNTYENSYEDTRNDILFYMDMAADTFVNHKVEERFSYGVLQLYKILESVYKYYIDVNHQAKIYQFKEKGLSSNKIYSFEFFNDFRRVDRDKDKHLNASQIIYNVYYQKTNSIDRKLFKHIYDLFQFRSNYVHHSNLNDFEKLEILYKEDFQTFRKHFYKYYSSVFKFICDITY